MIGSTWAMTTGPAAAARSPSSAPRPLLVFGQPPAAWRRLSASILDGAVEVGLSEDRGAGVGVDRRAQASGSVTPSSRGTSTTSAPKPCA